MDKSLLDSIVVQCEPNNVRVQAMVCDMGNGRLLSKLKVYSENTHKFENPVDVNRFIYIFPDVPHCLKNLRNHILDHNLVYKESEDKHTYLTREHFQQLLDSDSNDFKLWPKITLNYLYVKGNERQRVRYATQLLSDTVSKALIYQFGDEYSEQSKIISVIDVWFDVMNSRIKIHWKKNKSALGKT